MAFSSVDAIAPSHLILMCFWQYRADWHTGCDESFCGNRTECTEKAGRLPLLHGFWQSWGSSRQAAGWI
jgi:hypothetical protein